MWDFTQYKDNTALIDEQNNILTYLELYNAEKIIREVIPQRTLVFCMCENTIGSVVGYTAFVNNRVVPLMLNSHIDNGLYCKLLDIYKPQYIWLPEKSDKCSNKFKTVVELYDYKLVETYYGEKHNLYVDLALLLTTSGSTGSPKLVRQSYKNIQSNTDSIVSYLKISEKERAITTLPMNYTYGLSIINTHLKVGATILLTKKTLIQKEFWLFLKQYRATSFGGVPYTYEILDRLRFYTMELPSIRYMTQAGGKLSRELHFKYSQYASENGKEFIVMYGQCEATARMSYLPHEYSINKIGSIGVAIPNGKFEIVDQNGNVILAPYQEGELVYRGDNVSLGYAETIDDLCKGDEWHGVLHTGDIAQRDAEGFYYVVGRMSRFLKIFGNRVNLDEIDIMIKEKFAGIDVVSAGIDDNLTIYLTDDSIADEVRQYIGEKIKINISAIRCVTLDKIPKNESGKILFGELERYL